MKHQIPRIASLLTAMAFSLVSAQALAAKNITLMQLGDVHGHMHEHTEIFPDGRIDANSGGIAKLTTLINEVRADNPDSLLLAIGDTTHGSAEMLFSLGELIVPWLNSIGIDAFTPGNWDFGWGPRVYRQRFTPNTAIELAPNNRTTIAWLYNDPDPTSGKNCNVPGGLKPYSQCHLIKATFPTVAMNVYNFNEVAGLGNPAQPLGPLVHAPYIIKQVNGIKVAILGLTSDVVPQQAQAFNTGFRFTMGYKEMPANIAAAKADGAKLIVVMSELGLAKNVQMVKEFPEIDVMFSGHTHERTPEAIVIEHEGGGISIVTESGEDSFLGRLDLKLTGNGKIIKYKWTLMEADHTVPGDPAVDALVDAALEPFEDGAECHTFGVNAFPYGKGHTLCDSFDTVVGKTNVTIQRFNVLEDVSNNVMVDAFLDLATNLGTVDSNTNPLTDANTLSTTNGFRFDIVIPGDGEMLADGSIANGDITIGDLYDYYPIGAATALAEYTGGRLKLHWEGILNNVFDPNPYRQRGGWFLGFTRNMHFDIRLSDDYPLSISYGKRIANVTIDDGFGAMRIDDSKIYTLASCYPHGNPTDEVCRTSGATNLRFITAQQESTGPTDIFGNRQLDMTGAFEVVEPVVTDAQLPVFDPARTPIFRKVAPDNFVHPVDALRRYLAVHTVNLTDDGLGRVNAIDPVPVSEFGGPGIVQPTQGAGAEWLKREFIDD
ncbi:MAG: bifunctional metallophosphatase/5'-nucleotidase [Gammaproteobacteria bacterium]|nr:bifunctional metallophosphatase/5'-nucleotidase [Gammaproteobacteria bacterium]